MTLNVDLQQLYNDERQKSTIFRPTFKLDLLFYNAYSGSSNYNPYETVLYTVNENTAAYLACSVFNNINIPENQRNDAVVWSGLPQYHEFDFIRDDYNVSGYTSGDNPHVKFNSKSASTYNWNFYISYPFSSTTKPMKTYLDTPNATSGEVEWISENGIPFRISDGSNENAQFNGLRIIRFSCPVKHNLTPGEYVSLKIYNNGNPTTDILPYNGQRIFQVFSTGDGSFGTEEYVFNIANPGFTGNTFVQNKENTQSNEPPPQINVRSNSPNDYQQYGWLFGGRQ